MKKCDLIKVINDKPYAKYNIHNDMHGIVAESFKETVDVLFFNPNNLGDCAIVNNIAIEDILIEKEQLPEKMKKELELNMFKVLKNSKSKIEPLKIKEYDFVELLVEDEKYAKYGVHKGDTGCVMDDNAVQNYIQVDFSGIYKNGNYYGDCISVKIEDLKVKK